MNNPNADLYKRVADRLRAIAIELDEMSESLWAADKKQRYLEIACECDSYSGLFEPTTLENIAGSFRNEANELMEKAASG